MPCHWLYFSNGICCQEIGNFYTACLASKRVSRQHILDFIDMLKGALVLKCTLFHRQLYEKCLSKGFEAPRNPPAMKVAKSSLNSKRCRRRSHKQLDAKTSIHRQGPENGYNVGFESPTYGQRAQLLGVRQNRLMSCVYNKAALEIRSRLDFGN